MKRKDYDDDLLVDLIARGQMSYAEIARRVGLARSTARRIADGRIRPELQKKIKTRSQTHLADRRRGHRPSDGRFGKLPSTALRACDKASENGAAAGCPGNRKKDYDDDLLVDLIARGEISYGEIAERVGLDRSMVGMIARGESRAELQEKINTRMRACLVDKRRRPNQCRDRTGGAPPLPRGYRNKEYDDDLLVELIARGDMSHKRIAERVGLSRQSIDSIAAGLSRRDLLPRIAAMHKGIREEAHRLGARWLRGLLTRHIRDGLEGTGEFARRCRKDLIDKLFDPEILKRLAEPPAPEPEPPGADFDDLSIDLRRKIMQEIGGPCDDAGFVEIRDDAEDQN